MWYEIQERKDTRGGRLRRRVFVATDDPAVIREVQEKYSHYEVYANMENAQSAQKSRYTDASLRGMIVDFK